MGRKTLRRPSHQSSRPSTFFIVALAAGVLMLIVMAVVFIRNPPKPEPATTHTSFAAHAAASAA